MYNKVSSHRYREDFLKCSIPELTILPNNFSAIIGHAYGTHKNAKNDDFIADRVLEFLVKNRNYIEKIVFKGDVFSVPSKQRWDLLFDEFGAQDLVLVAPGNHDVEAVKLNGRRFNCGSVDGYLDAIMHIVELRKY